MHTGASVLLNTNMFFTALKVLKKIYDFFFFRKYLKVIVAFKGLFKKFIFLLQNLLAENTLYHNFTLVPKSYRFFSSAVKQLFKFQE